MIKNTWYVARLSSELEAGTAKPYAKVVAGQPLVMWRRKDGTAVAYDGRCSHKRFPLWEGNLREDGSLQCAYHGWCYSGEGQCVEVPPQPGMPISQSMNLIPFPCVEQDGLVWVWVGDREKAAGVQPPRTPEIGDASRFDAVPSSPIRLRASSRLLIENLLDITHFFPLHDGNIGDKANSEIPVELIEDRVGGNHSVGTSRKVEHYRLPPYYQRWFGYEVVDRRHTHVMVCPGLVRVELRVAPHGELGTEAERGYVLFHTTTTVQENELEWHWIMTCKAGSTLPSGGQSRLVDVMASEFPAVVKQDEWALVKQQEMYDLGLGDYRETNIRSDVAVIRARRVLAGMEREESGVDPQMFVPPTVLKPDLWNAYRKAEGARLDNV